MSCLGPVQSKTDITYIESCLCCECWPVQIVFCLLCPRILAYRGHLLLQIVLLLSSLVKWQKINLTVCMVVQSSHVTYVATNISLMSALNYLNSRHSLDKTCVYLSLPSLQKWAVLGLQMTAIPSTSTMGRVRFLCTSTWWMRLMEKMYSVKTMLQWYAQGQKMTRRKHWYIVLHTVFSSSVFLDYSG